MVGTALTIARRRIAALSLCSIGLLTYTGGALVAAILFIIMVLRGRRRDEGRGGLIVVDFVAVGYFGRAAWQTGWHEAG